MSLNETLTNIHPTLTAEDGDINITSGSNTNLIGAKLAAVDITIDAGDELNIYSVQDQSHSYSTASKSRNYSMVMNYAAPGLMLGLKMYDNLGIPIIGDIASNIRGALNGDFSAKSNLTEKQKITNKSSDINASGDITLTSNNNLTILGSNLNGDSGSLTSTAGDVNIYNVVDSEYSRSESSSSRTTLSSVAAGMIQSSAAIPSSSIIAMDMTRSDAQRYQDIKEATKDVGTLPQKQEQHIKITKDETIIASNLNFTNLSINSNQDSNIRSSNLTTTDSLNITSGKDANITTAVENDYSYSYDSKKTPTIAAALSNSITKVFNDSMPSFGRNKGDNTRSNDQINELVYDQDKYKETYTTQTNIASNINAGGNINISSQNNNLISGSNLSAGNSSSAAGVGNININAVDGVTIITSAQNQTSRSVETTTQDYNKLSLNYNRGRASADSESKVLEHTSTTNTTTQSQSTINAANNISITSKGNINILSSDLRSGISSANSSDSLSGTINLTSLEGNVNILSLQNSTSTTSEDRSGTLTLSAGIGSAHVDTAYAGYDTIEAAKNLADAKKELNHMETLRKNGQADDDAVEDAKINLSIAYLNLSLAQLKLAAAAAKSAASCTSSLCTGIYADLRLSIAGTKTNSSSSMVTNVASNINSSGNIVIKSGMNLLDTNTDLIIGTVGNTTITGSNISSNNGDINITSRNNTAINASKDTYNSNTTSKTWEENVTLGSSNMGATQLDAAINALQISLGLTMSRSKSDTSSTTYNNSSLTALNGNIKINSLGTKNGDGIGGVDIGSNIQSGGDTILKGANILASNVTINTQGNLTVESLQNSYMQKDKSLGVNLGAGGGASGKGGSVSAGVNYSSNKTDRLWTDNQTSIIGTNSVTINTGNNTNIKGAIIANIINADPNVSGIYTANNGNGLAGYNINSDSLKDAIDGGNLTINTGSLTFQNLEDHYYTKSFGIGLSTTIGFGKGGTNLVSNNTTGQGTAPANNSNQQNSFYPAGSTTLTLKNGSTKKEQTTKATIGEGDITTASTLTFDANGDLATNTGGTVNDITALSGLNRDINKSQVITKDMITGALDVSVTIDNRLFTENGRNQIGGQLNQSIEVGKIVLPKVWASPNTALGLAYGGVGYLYGAATGQDVKVSIGNNAVQFEGNPLGQNGAALTLGNSINYFGSANPDSGKTFDTNGEYYTYQAKQNYINSNGNYQFTDFDKIILGSHESQHTYQAETLGPLFLPIYFLSGGISNNNWLENEADKFGNNAYINWKNYENK